MEVVDSLKKWLSLLWLRYEMVTCIFMFEPWEKFLISKSTFCKILLPAIRYLITHRYIFFPRLSDSLVRTDFDRLIIRVLAKLLVQPSRHVRNHELNRNWIPTIRRHKVSQPEKFVLM